MPQDLPTAAELVEVAEQEVTALRRTADGPEAAPRLALVAHVLRIVARELRDGPAVDADERAGLLALLGGSTEEGAGETGELRAELAGRIRAGLVDPADPALLAHLRATAEATLTVASPRYVATRRG